jgi:DNA-binding transcriptional regulator YiaG
MKQSKRKWDKESIRTLRQHLGLTQTLMAEQLGTRQQTISEWETGMYEPRGASATLLSIIAEHNNFHYQVKKREEDSK